MRILKQEKADQQLTLKISKLTYITSVINSYRAMSSNSDSNNPSEAAKYALGRTLHLPYSNDLGSRRHRSIGIRMILHMWLTAGLQA